MQSDSSLRRAGEAGREPRRRGRRAGARFAPRCVIALGLALAIALAMPLRSQAQSYGAPPDAEAASAEFLPQDELDALLAPIALYPDDLLAQVLMASTYPLEVVEAARFVQQNPGLSGAALDDALQSKRWDPSVQSLTAFPQVLAMMSDRLEWTQQLGDAFLANRQQVMDTVQALRGRAREVGTLQDSDQQHVYTSDQAIVIEPAQLDYVYVPVYDPLVVYGPWWSASYQPFFWYPPPFFGYPARRIGVGIVWGRPCRVDRNHWGWAHPEWRAGTVSVTIGRNQFFNRPQYRNYRGTVSWQHVPEHRRGVAYGSALVRDRYVNVEQRARDARRESRAATPAATTGRQAVAPRPTLAAPQNAPAYRQVPPDTRAAPALRVAPSTAEAAAAAIPQSPSHPRVAPAPLPPRMIVTTPQAAPRRAVVAAANDRHHAAGCTGTASRDATARDRHYAAGCSCAATGLCAGSGGQRSCRAARSGARSDGCRRQRTIATLKRVAAITDSFFRQRNGTAAARTECRRPGRRRSFLPARHFRVCRRPSSARAPVAARHRRRRRPHRRGCPASACGRR